MGPPATKLSCLRAATTSPFTARSDPRLSIGYTGSRSRGNLVEPAPTKNVRIGPDAALPETETLQSCGTGNSPEKIEKILSKNKYDKIVVSLGSNNLGKGIAPESTQLLADLIRAKGNGATCDWIGPPHFDKNKGKKGFRSVRGSTKKEMMSIAALWEANLDGYYESLNNALATSEYSSFCHLMDSRGPSGIPQDKDTAHDGSIGNRVSCSRWSKGVYDRLNYLEIVKRQKINLFRQLGVDPHG